ncbi:hypothetical protein DV096_11695 [Bradymonadaceae bacterium TMQ3]|uniref:CCDC81 HU domain-containing protein n=1 Tax=Lujinxingia sediminis TaxID=2480984 RepID=A0ABY0CRH7_9DELT|nr:hypothetical protein [Lujinxingia sediminis]RDV37777.1 hypothetical protein DV096_11695 [Bradymonadaceae bacterium TMQ3]RVU43181.1 hypothetical protein EA187_13285 [Lujinxingia sediminis]TXC75440.1 hypothetical protein FRC91_12055 [Bradymonadales bacterium TMQ1]
MIEPSEHYQKIHVPPGGVFTGLREYACDGAVVRARVGGSAEEPRLETCEILELHDLNVGQRRTRHDVGAFLRRCLRRLQRDGLILVLGEQVLTIPGDQIEVNRVRFQQFCSRAQASGPFTSSEPVL